jgi:RecJ-like exonuclease
MKIGNSPTIRWRKKMNDNDKDKVPCRNCCGVGYFGLDSDCRVCSGTGKVRKDYYDE